MSEDIINDYILNAPFSNENAGFCKWTTAVKNGQSYFLKELLDPIYPMSKNLSEKVREMKIKECLQFEEKKKGLINKINSGSDGNVVRIEEFFRFDSHYYIATKQIKNYGITADKVVDFPLQERVFLCMSLAHSAASFHDLRIVHSDIKPTNILLKKTADNKLVGKIIDFDSSFSIDDPPIYEDELGGDQVYFSPEGCKFIYGKPVELSDKLDVFAFGLLFHLYLTGGLPMFDSKEYRYAHEAVLDDQILGISTKLPAEIQSILGKMVLCEPDQRPDMKTVFNVFHDYLYKSYSESINPVNSDESISKTTRLKINYNFSNSDRTAEKSEKTAENSDKTKEKKDEAFKYFHSSGDL